MNARTVSPTRRLVESCAGGGLPEWESLTRVWELTRMECVRESFRVTPANGWQDVSEAARGAAGQQATSKAVAFEQLQMHASAATCADACPAMRWFERGDTGACCFQEELCFELHCQLPLACINLKVRTVGSSRTVTVH